MDKRQPALVHTVAELGEQCRQNCQRAQHCDRDDHDRRHAEAGEGRIAGEQEPGHGDHDREARDQDRAPRGRRCGEEGRLLALPGRPFLALTLDVEHRVVDAHGEADEQNERADALVERQQLTGDGEQAHGRDDRRQREQDRQSGSHEAAERQQQDPDRQRDRELARLFQCVREGAVDLVLRGDAEALDGVTRMRVLGGLHRCDDGPDLVDRVVGVADDLDIDERGVAVSGDQVRVALVEGRVDRAYLGYLLQPSDNVVDHSLELGGVGSVRCGLNHHALGRGSLELVGQDPVDASRLPDPGLRRVELLGAEHDSEREGDGDEAEPSKDRNLAVLGAPASHARRNVPRVVHGALLGMKTE